MKWNNSSENNDETDKHRTKGITRKKQKYVILMVNQGRRT